MKKKKTPFKTVLQLTFVFTVFTILLASCNSKKSEGKNPDTDGTGNNDTVTTKSTEGAAAKQLLNTVIFTKEDQKALFANNDVKMIYFKFEDDGANGYVAEALAADNEGNEIPNIPHRKLSKVKDAVAIYFSATQHPYSNQITRGHLKLLLGLPTGTDEMIDKGSHADVWLTPCTRSDGSICYMLTEPKAAQDCKTEAQRTNREGQVYSNPSPPGTPCADDCDSETFLFPAKK